MGQDLQCQRGTWEEQVGGRIPLETYSTGGARVGRLSRRLASRGDDGEIAGCGDCCEPEGSITTTNWTYVGDGRGGYEKVQTYEFVGEGGGSFEKDTMLLRYGVRPRACCILFGFFAVFAAALYAVFGQHGFHADWRSFILVHRQIRDAGRAQAMGRARLAPQYNCAIGQPDVDRSFAPDSHSAICAAALLEAVWRVAERDGDGRVDRSEMAACERSKALAPEAIQVLKAADLDGDGTLDISEFAAALSKAGLAAAVDAQGAVVDIASVALVEAAWLALDKDSSGRITRPELGILDKQKHLSHRTLQIFLGEDANSDSALTSKEFQAGLSKCGLSSFVVSNGSRAVLDVAIAEAAWAVVSPDGGAVGKKQLDSAQQNGLLPLPALSAARVASAHSTGALTHGSFVAALVGAHLSGDFIRAAGSAPTLAARAAERKAADRPEPLEKWSPSKRLWCCDNTGVGCSSAERSAASRGTPPPFDCQEGLDHAELWEPDKRAWCCKYAHIGCAPYDCEAGYSDWMRSWSFNQQKWCCMHAGRGCQPSPSPPPPPSPVTTSAPFDCDAGYARWRDGWSDRKKAWCCQSCGRGCSPVVVEQTFDCAAGLVNWVRGWSDAKKDWCCKRYKKGCPFNPSEPYDCQAGLSNWNATWPAEKREWCCKHHGRGCPFDCDADYVPCQHCLMTRWSPAKRAWCCEHTRRGCVTTSSPDFDCTQGLANAEQTWTFAKKAWCCQHQHLGCPPPTPAPTTSQTPVAFDCEDGLADWQRLWAPLKKAWCCHTANVGCPQSTTSKPYDCQADFTTCYHCLRRRWSTSKRAWCCSHENRGCSTTAAPTSLPFDCNAAFANWLHAWSPEKKAWCCQHQRRGCPQVSTSLPFDCLAGLDNAERGWSATKLRWCCAFQRKGCKFDCRPVDSNSVGEWPDDKREWCCANFHAGCGGEGDTPDFDCLAGYSHWKEGWSDDKKAYCCKHYQRGCCKPDGAAANASAAGELH